MKVALLVNPTPQAKRAQTLGQVVDSILLQTGVETVLFSTAWPAHFGGFDAVWIAGGDGTLNWFVNQYPDCVLPIAALGGGSGNDFYWMLYGDVTIEKHVEALLDRATPQAIDAGICNGRLFLNGVGMGFDGAVVQDVNAMPKIMGKASYMTSVLKLILTFKEADFTMAFDETVLKQESLMVCIANGKRYGGGFLVAPHALPTDGMLDYLVVDKLSPYKRFQHLPLLESGKYESMPIQKNGRLRKADVQTIGKVPAHIDGEYFSTNHFEISILPQAFQFLTYARPQQKA